MQNDDILDAVVRLTKAIESINPRRRYHYATLPAEEVCQAARVCTDPDSYVSDDSVSAAARDLLKKGYRWVRCDCGLAVFEKEG